MDVSLNGALHTMHHELSQMAKQKNGVIVNIASILVKLVRHLPFNTALQRKK
jgi:NADP-dependent 3-hydroxy acid dehydrogenase YdfG